MNKIRLASFGIRGFVGESLPPDTVIDWVAAFASFNEGGRVLIGRDTRYSSPMLHHAALAGLLSAGCEVLDYGVCPTPLLQYAVRQEGARGAVSISGGHNTAGWNAVTLIGADGAFLDAGAGEAVLDRYHARDFRRCDGQHMGDVRPVKGYAAGYFERLAQLVDAAAIRRKGYTVLIDPVGGAGCPFLDEFARLLGLKLVPINGAPSGYLAREPEPRPRSALQMASVIQPMQGDVGFVLSSDMGRMSLVTEAGEPTSEEYTLALIANHVLARECGPLVTNICTTRTVDDVAALHGAPLIKTRVGQAYVAATLDDEQGVLGGEGSGSAVLPAFSKAFDGFLMMALILDLMTTREASLSAILETLPRYDIIKRSLPCASRTAYRGIELLKDDAEFLKDGEISMMDGIRVDWESGWVHVRLSQTQQILRIIAEARTRPEAIDLADRAARILQQVI
jgi:phosphomannomutase